MYGVNFGVFDQTLASLDFTNRVTVEQYAQRYKLGTHTPQTKVFHEAILGQDPYTTIVNIHAENHQRYFLSAASMTYLRLGLLNPSRLRMRCGANNAESTSPLVSTITSHSLRQMSQFIKVNASMEEQLDLNKILIDTLAAGGHVLVLGAGRLDICRELMNAANDGEYTAKGSHGWQYKMSNTLVFSSFTMVWRRNFKTFFHETGPEKDLGLICGVPGSEWRCASFCFDGKYGFANSWWVYESTSFYWSKTSCLRISLHNGQLFKAIVIIENGFWYILMSEPAPNQMPDFMCMYFNMFIRFLNTCVQGVAQSILSTVW